MATIQQEMAKYRQMVQGFESDEALLAFYTSCVKTLAERRGFWEKFLRDISHEEVLRRMGS